MPRSGQTPFSTFLIALAADDWLLPIVKGVGWEFSEVSFLLSYCNEYIFLLIFLQKFISFLGFLLKSINIRQIQLPCCFCPYPCLPKNSTPKELTFSRGLCTLMVWVEACAKRVLTKITKRTIVFGKVALKKKRLLKATVSKLFDFTVHFTVCNITLHTSLIFTCPSVY
jgi:hypothetical protein